MKRIVLVSGLGAFVSLGLMAAGCGSSSEATGGTGGAGPTGTGGATTIGTGGAPVTGTGGGSGINPMALPMCNAAPNAQTRDAMCTPGDPAMPDCMVRCGPNVTSETRGYRPLLCEANTNSPTGVGFVQKTCWFDPAQNYACHKLPSPPVPCPPGTASGGACTAEPCMPCGDGVDMTRGYMDSMGVAKAGFCLCNTNSTGAKTWTCGSNKEYPCYPAAPGAAVSPGCT